MFMLAAAVLIIACIVTFLGLKCNSFKITNEYQLIPDDFVLPPGMDIKIDVQTGQGWVKLPKQTSYNDAEEVNLSKAIVPSGENILDVDEKETFNAAETESKSKLPPYSNVSNKWQNAYSLVSKEIEAALEALSTIEDDESRETALQLLLEESHAMEVGAGIVSSIKFKHLRTLFVTGDLKAIKIISMCLQNNPVAVDKAIELKLHEDLLTLFKNVVSLEEEESSFLKLLLILDSFLINGDGGKPSNIIVGKLNEFISEIVQSKRDISSLPERQHNILIKINNLSATKNEEFEKLLLSNVVNN